MRFLVDMPLSPALSAWLTRQGHDSVHASEVGLGGASDPVILEYALGECRVVVTADLDYPRLLAMAGAEGPGLILFRGGDYGDRETKDRLAAAFRAIPGEDLSTSIVVVEKRRIRRRRLPIKAGP
jgi:predicted nuclease of predicted toxin-antitoxin system